MYLSPKPKGKRKWTQARFDARKEQLGIANNDEENQNDD